MKQTKKIFALLLTLCIIVGLVPLSASAAESGACGDDLTWTLSDDGTLNISGTGAIWGYNEDDPSTAAWLGLEDSITNIVISSGVTRIGFNAFGLCKNVTSITIPDGVTGIEDCAFQDCEGLKSVSLPESLTFLGNDLFLNCPALTDIQYGGSPLTWKGLLTNSDSSFTLPGTVSLHYEKTDSRPFSDVPTTAFYYVPVRWAVQADVTHGTSATTFEPDAPCTRAQAVTLIWNSAGSPTPESTSTAFTDINPHSYYYDAVLWAVEMGIVSGTSSTTFSPDQPCTRSQIVTFLHRYVDSPAYADGGNAFADVPSSAYYAKAVHWAVNQKITAGTSSTSFSPDLLCSRGQIVTFLYRFWGKYYL